jgi:hypothetical protein
MVLSAINRGIKGLDRNGRSIFRVYGVRLRGGIGMYKDFFVRFPGLRGTHVGWYFT